MRFLSMDSSRRRGGGRPCRLAEAKPPLGIRSYFGCVGSALLVLVVAVRAGAVCCGDCDGNGMVAINELVAAVGNALNGCPVSGVCCGDCDGSGNVTVNELVTVVGNSLLGCPSPPPTRTPKVGCPYDLLHPGSGMVCQFGAHLQGTCPRTTKSFWASDGKTVVIVFPGMIFGGRVINATSAQLIGWTPSPSGPIQSARHGDKLRISASG
jgi:hypothetical protein